MNNHEQPERRPEGKEGAGAHQERPERPQPDDVNKHKRSASDNNRNSQDLDPDNTD